MKKRPIIICLLVAILGSVIIWLQSNYIITGWLNGEAFYQGRPTSYWRRELDGMGVGWQISGEHIEYFFVRQSTSWQSWLDPNIDDVQFINDHPLLTGDQEAKEVLTELLVGSSAAIQQIAQIGLSRIKE